jgi:hypothetical protein
MGVAGVSPLPPGQAPQAVLHPPQINNNKKQETPRGVGSQWAKPSRRMASALPTKLDVQKETFRTSRVYILKNQEVSLLAAESKLSTSERDPLCG